jgi:DNA-binding transcriptional regulator YbjK
MAGVRRTDPDRRNRIISAAVDVIAQHGVANATHRKVAAAADVPLGSMTYHFSGIDEVARCAFERIAQESSTTFRARLGAATTRQEAAEAVAACIAERVWSDPRTLALSYELYSMALRDPSVADIMRNWMNETRTALRQYFDPLTCRGIDALIEGIGIHNSYDVQPLNQEQILELVSRVISKTYDEFRQR